MSASRAEFRRGVVRHRAVGALERDVCAVGGGCTGRVRWAGAILGQVEGCASAAPRRLLALKRCMSVSLAPPALRRASHDLLHAKETAFEGDTLLDGIVCLSSGGEVDDERRVLLGSVGWEFAKPGDLDVGWEEIVVLGAEGGKVKWV